MSHKLHRIGRRLRRRYGHAARKAIRWSKVYSHYQRNQYRGFPPGGHREEVYWINQLGPKNFRMEFNDGARGHDFGDFTTLGAAKAEAQRHCNARSATRHIR